MKFDLWFFLSFGSLPLIAALIFLGIAYKDIKAYRSYTDIRTGYITKKTYSTTGRAVGRGGIYYVGIKFYDEENNDVFFITSSFKNPPKDTVEVIYDKNNPSNASVNYFSKLWGGVLVFGFLGISFLFIAIIFCVASFAGDKKKKLKK